jgi:hypothetical protein
MLVRQLTVASLFSLALISPGSTQAAKTPLARCKADAERICPGIAPAKSLRVSSSTKMT